MLVSSVSECKKDINEVQRRVRTNATGILCMSLSMSFSPFLLFAARRAAAQRTRRRKTKRERCEQDSNLRGRTHLIACHSHYVIQVRRLNHSAITARISPSSECTSIFRIIACLSTVKRKHDEFLSHLISEHTQFHRDRLRQKNLR